MTKSIRRNVIVSALLAICLCASLIAGATFAIFTSESKVNIAVTSGKVKAEATVSKLEAYSPKTIASDGSLVDETNTATKDGEKWTFGNGGTTVYDEENNKLELDKLTPGDKVTFKITVKNLSNVKAKYRTRVLCDEDTGLFDELAIEIGTYRGRGVSQWAELSEEDIVLDCIVELPGKATVQDKSCVISFIVEAVQGNAETKNDTAYYSLKEFNELTEIPEGIKNVYLSIGAVSLKDGGVTIGNKDICDMWTWDRDINHTAGEILEDGRKVYMVRENDTIYSSNKSGINLYISGSVNDNKDGGLNNKGNGDDPRSITLSIPDASNVVFTENFTVNGYFRMYTGWSDGRNLGGAVYNRTVKTVLFDHSTFNGIWIQNGGFGAESLTLDGCVFNAYENKVSANDSNPLWFCNTGSCDITVKHCSFKASRPIKLAEQSANGTELTIIDNTFDMSVANSANKETEPKNDAIMLCAIGNGALGNVVIGGNKVINGTALMAFYNPIGFTMTDGATFKVSDNVLNGAKLGVVWKSTTEYTPEIIA